MLYTNEKNFLKNEKIDVFLLPRFLKRYRKVVILRDIAQYRRDNRVFPSVIPIRDTGYLVIPAYLRIYPNIG